MPEDVNPFAEELMMDLPDEGEIPQIPDLGNLSPEELMLIDMAGGAGQLP